MVQNTCGSYPFTTRQHFADRFGDITIDENIIDFLYQQPNSNIDCDNLIPQIIPEYGLTWIFILLLSLFKFKTFAQLYILYCLTIGTIITIISIALYKMFQYLFNTTYLGILLFFVSCVSVTGIQSVIVSYGYIWMNQGIGILVSILAILYVALLTFRIKILKIWSLLVFSVILGFLFYFLANLRSTEAYALFGACFYIYSLLIFKNSSKKTIVNVAILVVVATSTFSLLESLHINRIRLGYCANLEAAVCDDRLAERFHTAWHPIVLALAVPATPISKKYDFTWNDVHGKKVSLLFGPGFTEQYSEDYDAGLKSFMQHIFASDRQLALESYFIKFKSVYSGYFSQVKVAYEKFGIVNPVQYLVLATGSFFQGIWAFLGIVISLSLASYLYFKNIISEYQGITLVLLSGYLGLKFIEAFVVYSTYLISYHGGVTVVLSILLSIWLGLLIQWLISLWLFSHSQS